MLPYAICVFVAGGGKLALPTIHILGARQKTVFIQRLHECNLLSLEDQLRIVLCTLIVLREDCMVFCS